MQSPKVINLFGAPGVGKSTVATGLFNLMNTRGQSVEYVSEYAKDLTWGKNWMGLAHQPTILAEQDFRLYRLRGQVEWVITDSPLPLGIAYMGEEWTEMGLDRMAWDMWSRYENLNVLVNRNRAFPYEGAGRNQDEAGAMVLDNVIDNIFHTAILDDEDLALELTASHDAPYRIYNWLMGLPRGTA